MPVAQTIRTDTFLDTNVVLYLSSSDAAFAGRSEELLSDGAIISVQVLNEATRVMRHKWHVSWADIDSFLTRVRINVIIVPLTVETHDRARMYAERHQLNVFDASIVAAAVLAGCTTLWSEDMHDGLVIDGLTIRNPYV
jgi:predicted nucleic acid-binding protein